MPLDHEPIMQPSLQSLYMKEYQRAQECKRSGKLPDDPVGFSDDDSYKAECSVIPKEALRGASVDSLIPSDFKLVWGHGSRCCVAALPFDNGCNNKAQMEMQGTWESFINNGRYLRILNVMRTTRLAVGFTSVAEAPGKYYDLLPDMLQKDVDQGGCSFDVAYLNPRDMFDPTDRKYFMEKCQKALGNLKKILGAMSLNNGDLN